MPEQDIAANCLRPDPFCLPTIILATNRQCGGAAGGLAESLHRKEKDGAEAVGFLFTPTISGQLERIEMLLQRETGTGNVVGYLMTDSGGPGRVIATFSIFVRSSSQAEIVSASLNMPVLIERSKHYWFMLEANDAINDSTFWPRIENQPATTIAIRRSKSESWHMNGAYGAMLRMYAR